MTHTHFRILDIRGEEPVTAVSRISADFDFLNKLWFNNWQRLDVTYERAAFLLDYCGTRGGFTLLATVRLDVAGFEQVTGRVVEDTAVYAAREQAGELLELNAADLSQRR